jgi:hypothetical protein
MAKTHNVTETMFGRWRAGFLRPTVPDTLYFNMRCPNCGYDLRHLTERRCPECGKPFDPDVVSRQPCIRLHAWLHQPSWWSRAAAVPRLCLRPSVAVGSDVSLDARMAPLAPRLLGWAIFWHAAIVVVLLMLGALIGSLFGLYRSSGAMELIGYLAANILYSAFGLLIWSVLSLIVAWGMLWGWSQRINRYNVAHLATLLFAFGVAGEGVRRIVTFLVEFPAEIFSVGLPAYFWRVGAFIGYGVYVVLVWVVVRIFHGREAAALRDDLPMPRMRNEGSLDEMLLTTAHLMVFLLRLSGSFLPFAILVASVAIAWCFEGALYGFWFRYVAQPLLSFMGLW